MLARRIIPCLDIKDGLTVKGVNFTDLRQAGDPVELAERYTAWGADELCFLDISATEEDRSTLYELVREVARVVDIPFTVGGGVRSVKDVGLLLEAGADKVSVNSAAVRTPQLIDRIARHFGSQCLVVAIDSRKELNGMDRVYVKGGKDPSTRQTLQWARQAEERGAGELLLTSMNHDGTKQGFAVELSKAVAAAVGIPVIASGGAGKPSHFVDLFKETTVTAALAASIFHFNEVPIPALKDLLAGEGIAVRHHKQLS